MQHELGVFLPAAIVASVHLNKNFIIQLLFSFMGEIKRFKYWHSYKMISSKENIFAEPSLR